MGSKPGVERVVEALDLGPIVRVPLGQQEGVASLQLEPLIAKRLPSEMVDESSIGSLGHKPHGLGSHHPVILFAIARAENRIEGTDKVEHLSPHVETKPMAGGHLRPARQAGAGGETSSESTHSARVSPPKAGTE